MRPWTRRTLLQSVGAAGLVGCRQPDPRPKPPGTSPSTGDTGKATVGAPNIVYIYSDQHRAPLLGCYGHPFVQSPNLDALAAESVLFPNMFTNAPLCRPARATMMTGRMPHLTGSWNNEQLASPVGPSHVRRIRDEAGYRTAMIGKAHLTLPPGTPMAPANVAQMEDWGFEYTLELLSQIVCADKPNPYSEWLTGRTPSGEVNKAERYGEYVVAWEHLGFPPPDVAPYALPTEDHVDLWCGELAAEWIRTVEDDRPFYLQVNFPGPHSPYDATTEFRALYDPSAPGFPTAILGPPEAPISPLVQFLYSHRPELHGLGAADSRDLLMTYFAKVTLIDRAVGTVLAALEARGLLDDTWVVYGSDHGDLLGDHELWGKIAMYEGSIRTPLIARPPGGTAPWTSDGKIDQVDVTATILELAGLVPDGTGVGRLAQWAGGADGPGAQDGKDSIVAEVEGHPGSGLRTGMLRRDRYKLVYDFDAGRPVELYDLEADPDERANRIQDPGMAATIGDLRDELLSTIEAEVAAG